MIEANEVGVVTVKAESGSLEETFDRQFWEDELEMPLARLLEVTENKRAMTAWSSRLDGRQSAVLCGCLGEPGLEKLKEQQGFLQDNWRRLGDYYLVDAFAYRKSKVAIQDVALTPGALPASVLEACELGSGDYDAKALLLALYGRSPDLLRLVFHLDKVHKSGFARMRLQKPPRAPDHSFREFATPRAIADLLAEHDDSLRDRRRCELKRIHAVGDEHLLIFVRRPYRNRHILSENGEAAAGQHVVHGYSPEWIVLDFYDNARSLGICSSSNDVPMDLANLFASRYFQKDCEYANECLTTYPAQIERLLEALKDNRCEGLGLLQFQLRQAPFKGSTPLKVGPAEPSAISKAAADLEANFGPLFSDIGNVEKIKVEYRQKKVEMRFEAEEAAAESGSPVYVVRYFDHRLNLEQRYAFEAFMRSEHGIEVLSTEKRFKRKS